MKRKDVQNGVIMGFDFVQAHNENDGQRGVVLNLMVAVDRDTIVPCVLIIPDTGAADFRRMFDAAVDELFTGETKQ